MDEASLKSLIGSLESQRDALGFWLNLFSGMVAAGVIAEIAFVIREYWDNLHNWRRGIVRVPDRPSRLWFVFEVLGVALVSIGVAGEFLVDVKAGSLETQIRKSNGDLILFLEREVNDAEASATKAAVAAAQATSDAGAAKAKSESASKSAGSAHTEADWASTMAAKAEAALAERSLTDKQVKTIATKLSSFMGQSYAVTAYWDSKESMGITNRIHMALQMAQWSYSSERSKSFMLGGVIGVQVWTHPDADPSAKLAASSLVDALNAEGIEAIAKEQNPKNPKTNMINLNIGAKR